MVMPLSNAVTIDQTDWPDEGQQLVSNVDSPASLVKDESMDGATANTQPEKSKSRPARKGRIFGRLQGSATQTLTKCSNKLDPFAALPVSLNKFQEGLLRFYLFRYPYAQYGFSPQLKPHPVFTNFNISLSAPACFHVILARAAMTQIHLGNYNSEQEKRALEQATLKYKGEAIKTLQELSVQYNRTMDATTKDKLLASIMSLGNLDRRAGAAESAATHYTAIRRIHKTTGGPLAIKDPALRRVSLFFECMYGTNPESYVYDTSDFSDLLKSFNEILKSVWTIAAQNPIAHSDSDSKTHRPYLGPDSRLYAMLSKRPEDPLHIKPPEQLEMVWQLTCTLMLAAIIVDNYDKATRLESYMESIHRTIEEGPLKLSAGNATTNVMWLLFQGSAASSKSPWTSEEENEHSGRMLRVVGWMFVCRYLSFTMRMKVKTWLLEVLTASPGGTGEAERPKLMQLSLFDFSYACG